MAQYVRDFAVQYGGDDPRHAVLWGKTTCQSRWTLQFKRYTTRERKSSSTGLGITEEMLVNGVTISAMIEKACPFYEPIDALFAEQANVNPESQCHVPDLSDDEVPLPDNIAIGQYASCSAEIQHDEDHEFDYIKWISRLQTMKAAVMKPYSVLAPRY